MALYKFCCGLACAAASPPMAAVTLGGSQSTMSVPPKSDSTIPMGTCRSSVADRCAKGSVEITPARCWERAAQPALLCMITCSAATQSGGSASGELYAGTVAFLPSRALWQMQHSLTPSLLRSLVAMR